MKKIYRDTIEACCWKERAARNDLLAAWAEKCVIFEKARGVAGARLSSRLAPGIAEFYSSQCDPANTSHFGNDSRLLVRLVAVYRVRCISFVPPSVYYYTPGSNQPTLRSSLSSAGKHRPRPSVFFFPFFHYFSPLLSIRFEVPCRRKITES